MGFLKAYLVCVVVFLVCRLAFDAPKKIKDIVVESRKSEAVQAVKSKIKHEFSRYVMDHNTDLDDQALANTNVHMSQAAKKIKEPETRSMRPETVRRSL